MCNVVYGTQHDGVVDDDVAECWSSYRGSSPAPQQVCAVLCCARTSALRVCAVNESVCAGTAAAVDYLPATCPTDIDGW